APADDGAVERDGAGVRAAGAHLGEESRGWCALAGRVVAPAGQRAIARDRAAVRPARGDLCRGDRWRRLTRGVVAPARDEVAIPDRDGAGVRVAGGDMPGVLARRRRGLAGEVCTPADQRPIALPDGTGMAAADRDVREAAAGCGGHLTG